MGGLDPLGQLYRLNRDYEKAFAPLLRAASTPLPVRALFQWRYMYDCLVRGVFCA